MCRLIARSIARVRANEYFKRFKWVYLLCAVLVGLCITTLHTLARVDLAMRTCERLETLSYEIEAQQLLDVRRLEDQRNKDYKAIFDLFRTFAKDFVELHAHVAALEKGR